MAKTSRPRKACRLLTLPPEVRNSIYEKVLSTTGIIRPNVDALFRIASAYERYGERFTVLPLANVLALALTCRQIHNEALRFYYGRNTFSFSNTYDLYRYLYMIGEERRQCIKSIEILWQGERRREAAEMLAECINLQRLYIGVSSSTTDYTKYPQQNLWVSRGIGQLKKIRGFPNLDLRVREVIQWGKWCQFPLFELSISEALQCIFKNWHSKFNARHIEEFEKGLKEQIGMPGKESAVEEDVVGNYTVETVVPTRKTREPKGRILRARKIAPRQKKERKATKFYGRKARRTGEMKRKAPPSRYRS